MPIICFVQGIAMLQTVRAIFTGQNQMIGKCKVSYLEQSQSPTDCVFTTYLFAENKRGQCRETIGAKKKIIQHTQHHA